MWHAQIPIPLGELLPRAEGRDDHPLQLGALFGHILFGEGLGHIARHPTVEHAPIRARLLALRDRAGHLAQEGRGLERQLLRRQDGQRRIGQRRLGALKELHIGVGAGNARAEDVLGQDHMQGLALLQTRHGEDQALGLVVVDIGCVAAVARGGAGVLGNVNGLDRAIEADHLRHLDLGLREALLIPHRQVAQFHGPGLGQRLAPEVEPRGLRPIGLVLHVMRLGNR